MNVSLQGQGLSGLNDWRSPGYNILTKNYEVKKGTYIDESFRS